MVLDDLLAEDASQSAAFGRAFAAVGLEQPAFVLNRRAPSRDWLIKRASGLSVRRRQCQPPTLKEFIRDYYMPMAGGATNFTLTLDTTAPAGVTIGINGATSPPGITNRAVTANIATSDGTTTGYMMKIYGDVDNTVNPNIQTTQGASAWIAYSATQAVTLSTGDGTKNLNAIVRDDVGNPSTTATTSTTLDTVAPIPNITVAATPTKISKVASFNVSTFTWQSDSPYQAYEIAVVASAGSIRGSGTVIGTANGSTNMTASPGTASPGAATTNIVSTINGADLQAASAADGAKIVKIFVQDVAGNWSI